jgi:hypothetical protein
MKKGRVRKNIVCVDGFKFSVQASEGHKCYPPVNQNLRDGDTNESLPDYIQEKYGINEEVINVHYTHLECGLPSVKEDLLIPWHECADKDENGNWYIPYYDSPADVTWEGVYYGVPARVVMDVIVKHGGIVSGSLPPLSFNKE